MSKDEALDKPDTLRTCAQICDEKYYAQSGHFVTAELVPIPVYTDTWHAR